MLACPFSLETTCQASWPIGWQEGAGPAVYFELGLQLSDRSFYGRAVGWREEWIVLAMDVEYGMMIGGELLGNSSITCHKTSPDLTIIHLITKTKSFHSISGAEADQQVHHGPSPSAKWSFLVLR